MSIDHIESAQSLLDQQSEIAIWYAEYEGRCETIYYVNEKFAEIFGMPIDQVLEKKRYSLVNPPGTSAETLAQYQREDLEAISKGYFFSYRLIEPGKELLLVKLRFDHGVIGLFKIVEEEPRPQDFSVQHLDDEFRNLLYQLRPDLQP